ncbi:unnamed protein product, partial [Amoebophrya sp. A25]
ERSYQGLLDLRLWQDKYLSRKLDLLRRNWCKPYDSASQSCFMLGTWILLGCAALLVVSRAQTRLARPLQLKFGLASSAVSFVTMSSITVGGLVLLEGLLKRRHKYEAAVRELRHQIYDHSNAVTISAGEEQKGLGPALTIAGASPIVPQTASPIIPPRGGNSGSSVDDLVSVGAETGPSRLVLSDHLPSDNRHQTRGINIKVELDDPVALPSPP